MQITLVQAEIEQAITEYIHTQINVRAGMAIEIDLAATRGQQGFTASINIVPATKLGSGRPVNEAVQLNDAEPTPVVTRPLAISRAINKPKPEAEAEPTTEANAPVEVQQALPLEEAKDGTNEEAVTQTTATRPSLFKGLAKPVNS